MKPMLSLAVESSCDETAAAVLEGGREVLSNVIRSQINLHQKFGGVVPEVASRNHVLDLNPVIEQAMSEAGVAFNQLDFISATYGPGLAGALLTGLSAAKGLAYALEVPFVGVHHIEGHIAANYIAHRQLEPPFLCLVVSGGHTHLVKVSGYTEFTVLGHTRDDAAGEAFDKVARSLGLGYPGGPLIDQIATTGDPKRYSLPRAWLEEGSLDFSFSGLKSAVLNVLNQAKMKQEKVIAADLAASFQAAVTEVLVEKTLAACRQTNVRTVVLAGGVSANQGLRTLFSHRCQEAGLHLFYPPLALCTDNAAMIGAAGYYRYQAGQRSPLSLNAAPSLQIGQSFK